MNTFIGRDAKPNNIGRQFDNVGTYVLDPDGDAVVLRGAVGELCVSGKLVGKGYLNRPDLTAKAFPTLARNGERVYRTGDLVRMLADESFSFIGRKDMQVKLRGQRLEVGEIDSVVKVSSSSVEDALSLVINDEACSRQTLVTFVVSTHVEKVSTSTVDRRVETQKMVGDAMQACKQHLPSYMVPTHFIPLTKFPLTVNNKIDSKAISALYRSMSISELQDITGSASRAKPLSKAERDICGILCSMLKITAEDVHTNSNLFSLGLSSVSAITLASLLKRHPTLGRLATSLHDDNVNSRQTERSVRQSELRLSAFAQRYRTAAARLLSIDPHSIESIAPCTPLQAGLLLDSMRGPERSYFNEFRYRLSGLDRRRLAKAFESVNSTTGLMRTVFVQTEGGYAQVVVREGTLGRHVVQLLPGDVLWDDQRSDWLLANQQGAVRPFQVVINDSTIQPQMVIYAHHALYDGIAWDLFMDRLAEAYLHGAVPNCGPSFTNVLPHGPLFRHPEAETYWRNRLSGTKHAPLKSASESCDSAGTSTATLTIRDTSRMESRRKDLEVPHHAMLQACFEVVSSQHFCRLGSYGQVYPGRSIAFEGADQVIGPLFNTLPVPLDVDPAGSWRRHTTRCHQANVALIPFQHTPLSDVRRWCGRDAALFDVLFVSQHQQKQPLAKTHDLWHAVQQAPVATYPLSFEATVCANGSLELTAVAKQSVADQATLSNLLYTFKKALDTMIESPEERIDESFDVTRQDRRRTVDEKAEPEPYMNGVHDFIWTQDAVALRGAIAQVAGVSGELIDEHSTIFALGLDSIDAVKLSSKAKKAGVMLPVSRILQAQTIPRMLKSAREAETARSDATLTAKPRVLGSQLRDVVDSGVPRDHEIESVLPATPNQEALLADMFRSGFKEYYNHDILRVREGVNVEKLLIAWQMVIERSPILRTSFLQVAAPDVGATFAQVIWRPGQFRAKQVSISAWQEVHGLMNKIADDVRSTASTRSPLRMTLVRLASEFYMVLSLAHAQYDGHSLALLHHDVRVAYDDTYGTRPSYEPLITEALAAAHEEAREFWASCILGADSLPFPTRTVANGLTATHRAERVSQLSAGEVQSLCKRHGVSIQALAQTCWSLLLAHCTRAFEVIFGVVLACRDSEESEQMMFPAMNTVPVRATLHGSRLEMLHYMQSMITEMRQYQRTPLRAIQAACAQAGHVPNGSGLFDTLFVYQHRPQATGSDTNPLYESVGGSSNVEYPIAVEMEVLGDKLVMRAACKDTVLNQTGTSKLLKLLDSVLCAILEDASEPAVDFLEAGVSICGLPAFAMETAKRDDPSDVLTTSEDVGDPTHDLTPAANIIREILAQVARLPVDTISPTATIESIGIDSISAIKVAALLRKQDVDLAVSEILRAKTAVRMAKTVASKSAGNTTQAIPAGEQIAKTLSERDLTTLPSSSGIDADKVEIILPTTAGQVYMLRSWRASQGQLFYPTFRYELEGDADAAQLHRAWRELVAGHAILRTIFCETDDEAMPMLQAVLKERESVPAMLDEEEQKERSAGQPLVALGLRKIQKGWQLELTIHHALYDAVSLPLLIGDFKTLLAGGQLVGPSIHFPDFLALSVTHDALHSRKMFWTEYLQDIRPMRLRQPAGHGRRKRVETYRPGLFMDVPALEGLARREGVTIQAMLFAAYARIYAGLADPVDESKESTLRNGDVVLGIYLSNRSHLSDLDQLAAPTLNLVPLPVRSPLSSPLTEVAKQVLHGLAELGSARNSAVGLWEVAEWTGVKVDTYVNFLKLPERSEGEGSEDKRGDDLVIKELDEKRTTEYSRVVEPVGADEFEVPRGWRDREGDGAYLVSLVLQIVSDTYTNVSQHSIDLEATVSAGALDVGLFCPEEMLGLEQSEDVLVELRRMLEESVGQAEC
ncbi:hypothetical protein LTR53_015254 [Teratosphaeriaceae sp. CCFEE 6253]|nr:hypothetical protein LTR53_015254 [Teratosphaeriaceae sp. CCFEE 6253]